MVTANKKRALLDASSAIILFHVGLHRLVTAMYDVVLSQSVYDEITSNAKPGSNTYRKMLDKEEIAVVPSVEPESLQIPEKLRKLGDGERDSCLLYHAKMGDFLITDDGEAAKYCQDVRIPFINGLLIPRIVYYSGIEDAAFCREKFQGIVAYGRYSSWVIAYAKNCEKDDLAFFLSPVG